MQDPSNPTVQYEEGAEHLVYLDYLDYTTGHLAQTNRYEERLRYDLLLFADSTLCLSVPACIKLDSTARVLMQLTPFWSAGRIRPILSGKHRGNPWHYFSHRQKLLESEFDERQLLRHFEFRAYNSERTRLFYNEYLPQVARVDSSIYLPKTRDTDQEFRLYTAEMAVKSIDAFSAHLPIDTAIRLNGLMTVLANRATDKGALFQRVAVINDIHSYRPLLDRDELYVRNVLDRAFIYANASSVRASPVSFIQNRFTSLSFIPVISKVDPELHRMIGNLDWLEVYYLATSSLWMDFLDRLNYLMLCVRELHHLKLPFTSGRIDIELLAGRLVYELAKAASESIAEEAAGFGVPYVMLYDSLAEERAKSLLLTSIGPYGDALHSISELLPSLKSLIRSFQRPYRRATIRIGRDGLSVKPPLSD